jgi:hypothetical protein
MNQKNTESAANIREAASIAIGETQPLARLMKQRLALSAVEC